MNTTAFIASSSNLANVMYIKEDFENNLEIEKPYNQFLIWCYEDFGKMQQEGTKKLIFN